MWSPVQLQVAGVGGVARPPARSMRTAATLNSGIFDSGSTARLVNWFAAFATGPVVGDEHGVGPDRVDDVGRQRDRAAPRSDGDHVAIGDAERLGELGCISHNGSGYWATSAAMRRVWVPDRYCDTTRPVVSSTG